MTIYEADIWRPRVDSFFSIGTTITGTSYLISSVDIAYKKECSNIAAVTLLIDDSSAEDVVVGTAMQFFVSAAGAAGITGVTVDGGSSQTLIQPDGGILVPTSRTMSLTYIRENTWLYTGP